MTSGSQGNHPLVTASQAQHEHISSLHRCAARKAELLVVACREDCDISHRCHWVTLTSRRANFFRQSFIVGRREMLILSVREVQYCGREGLVCLLYLENDRIGRQHRRALSKPSRKSGPSLRRCQDPQVHLHANLAHTVSCKVKK